MNKNGRRLAIFVGLNYDRYSIQIDFIDEKKIMYKLHFKSDLVLGNDVIKIFKELKEKYGNCVIETVGKCDFYEDLFLMLKSFLKHVQIKKHIYLTEEELSGDSITTCEITYSCVIELRI